MASASQKNREVKVKSVLADDTLLFRSMEGREELGRLCEFRLELLSADFNIDIKKMLGTAMSVELAAQDGTREFNGIVCQFSVVDDMLHANDQERLISYRVVVRSCLWLLTRVSHCRFFHDRSVLEIVKVLLDESGIDYESKCTETYPKLDHCAQYQETDFDFFSRLLEREGIYYYFAHQGGKDKLILADSAHAHAPLPDYDSIAFTQWFSGKYPLTESVYQWHFHTEIASDTSELNAFDFQNVKSSQSQGLLARANVGNGRAYVLEDYTALYRSAGDGRRYAQVHIEAHRSQSAHARARATARGVCPGGTFTLTEHPRGDQNGVYLVTCADYQLESDYYLPVEAENAREAPVFECTFVAIPNAHAYRSPRRTPCPQAGPQTALVIAPNGDEIATNEHGQIKVEFHWEQFNPPAADRRMQRCWVRVAQNWAGKNWGTMFLPRVGQEVIVTFLDANVDHPIVIGCVYNSTNQPPYALPSNAAVATIRTNSTKGGGGYNELRFNDTKGKEQLFFHAEKAWDSYIKQDALTWVGGDKHLIVEGEQRLKVGSQHTAVTADQNTKVNGSVSLQADMNVVHKAGVNYVAQAEIVHIKAGANVVIESAGILTLKAGGSFVVLNPAGVQISGTLITLNSGGAAGTAPGGSPASPNKAKKADDGSSVK